MSQQENLPPQPEIRLPSWEKYLDEKEKEKVQKAYYRSAQAKEASETFISRMAPWFLEFGSWIFGGLIAYSIVLIQAPILNSAVTRGDQALVICTLMLALALPLDIIGLIVLRLFGDLRRFDLENEFADAFSEMADAADPTREKPDQAAIEHWQKKRLALIFHISVAILLIVLVLTIAATVAAMWYVMWWVAGVFLLMIGATSVFLILLVTFIQPRARPKTQATRAQ